VSIEIIEQRLKKYDCQNRLDEINAIKEISQEIALMALSKSGFFKVAEFHGGTALRIIYGINRFSEDLDFALLAPQTDFTLGKYLTCISDDFEAYGFYVDLADRKDATKTIQKQFLKVSSLGTEISLIYPKDRAERRIKIKFELDTNPPIAANTEIKYLVFPLAFSVLTKDLPSMFAGKLHALLCRPYEKGRDWYDFIWFASNRIPVNYALLENAIYQQGPWAKTPITVNQKWLVESLCHKIQHLSWGNLVSDVRPLLKAYEQDSLDIWGEAFFLDLVKKL